MAQDKKLGTFGGVFTPSILTILGVIMYMRLPWIVGQAGFYLTAGIIILAHVVSISTGLSVSSIATDKKVKAGGTYYIISRSLGLPIGGTLGVALFFGLSLSVSLYIIGFSESFLGFWDIPITKDTIRITGTIAVIFVATLTFISTSLAIKTQYFIMAAIGLSLITILFGKTDFVPVEPLLNPIAEMSPIILLFAIFFPAVTGFEAGVSMSGDLKDPKKSIPVGTISAIAVGLLVYIGLAAFFAYNVNSDQLINNPNILYQLSFFAPLVVAGIWGATLSSAIGSILGAPRILQATSADRITPRIFATGYGKTNEPRNALLLTFVIAEVGILIGELNLIARIVSMFFITTYGFLNLSSTLERWASTDFRPSFKIPAVISIIGALVCFILMLELDFVALIGATILMGAVFIYLKKKELTLESGDTWEGVWSSVLRSGLNRLNRTVKQQRNWRPNIILFSGGSTARPYLLEFGRWLVHQRGILSNFNLIENKNAEHLSPVLIQDSDSSEEKFQGIFARNMEVNNIYEGMETITKVYGFAGIEPNSVMLGWARNSKKPIEFSELIKSFRQLDYNIFLLDYDSERGFGNNKTIDLWWRGGSNTITLAFALVKFLQISEEWEESVARIFIVNNDSALNNRIYKNLMNILEEQRMNASIKIINNAIDDNPIQEIIKIESSESDLVILGLPEIEKEKAAEFIERTDRIINSLGTILLIHASSFFKPVYVGIDKASDLKKTTELAESEKGLVDSWQQLILPKDELLANTMKDINKKFENIFLQYRNESIQLIHNGSLELVKDINKLIQKNFTDLEEALSGNEIHRIRKTFSRVQSNYLFNSLRIIQNFQTTILPEQKENLLNGIQTFKVNFEKIQSDTPSELIVYQNINESSVNEEKGFFKKLKRKLFKRPDRRKIRMQALVKTYIKLFENEGIFNYLSEFGLSSYRVISSLQKLFTIVLDSLQIFEKALDKGELNDQVLIQEKLKIEEQIQAITVTIQNEQQKSLSQLQKDLHMNLQNFAAILESKNINQQIKKLNKDLKKNPVSNIQISNIPDSWLENEQLITNFLVEDLYLKNFENRIEKILERFISEIDISIGSNYVERLDELFTTLESISLGANSAVNWPVFSQDTIISQELFENLIKDIVLAEDDLPENIEIMAEHSFQNIEQDQFGNVATLQIKLNRYIDFLVETELINPLQQHVTELSTGLQKTNEVAQDIIRFTNHNIALIADDKKEIPESVQVVIKNGQERVKTEKKRISELQEKLLTDFNKLLQSTFDKMNPYLITRSIGEIKQTIRTQESRKVLSKITNISQKVKLSVKNLLVRLIYQKSESVLLAKKFTKATDVYQTESGRILETVRQLSPNSEINQVLPFYYKQLFLGKHIVNRDFLIGRTYELQRADESIDLYRQGYFGGLLILGDRYSGKSTLSRSIAAKNFDNNKVFEIHAPYQGSIELNEFKNLLVEVIQKSGYYDSIFNSIPKNSVIIFHDLELWWERSHNGFTVIDEIIELIGKYSDKCLFIVNTDMNSFKFINRLKNIENSFISAIKCQPFDSEEIQNAILLRHRSSGLKFEFDGHPEDSISNLRLARLFNKYFDISEGNIGQAIHYWISNITKVKSQLLYIQNPVSVSDKVLNKINKDWLLIMQQFMLHKHLSSERLSRIMGDGSSTLLQLLISFRRSGLIQDIQPDVFQISPYIQPIITKRLSEMDLL
ncbi:hypothetical protein ACFLSX_02245 [Calditrichota bacterium]